VRWLWPGRFACGKLTLLEGDPDVGKSTLLLDIAARVTTGRPMPDGYPGLGEPAGVLLIATAEDGLADTIRPRLEAAGADLRLVTAIVGVDVPGDDVPRLFELPGDAPLLAALIATGGHRLAIVDATMAVLPAEVNSHRDQDVRRALHPVAAIADESGAVIALNRHHTKQSGGKAIHRGGGSIAFSAVARATLMAVRNPADDGGRLLAVASCNLARDEDKQTLSYRIVSAEVPLEDGGTTSAGRIEWGTTDPRSANQLLRAGDSTGKDEDDEPVDAVQVLLEALADGPLTSAGVEQVRELAGIGKVRWEKERARAVREGLVRIDQEGRKEGKGGRAPVWYSITKEGRQRLGVAPMPPSSATPAIGATKPDGHAGFEAEMEVAPTHTVCEGATPDSGPTSGSACARCGGRAHPYGSLCDPCIDALTEEAHRP
jgi:hypothetical protein